MKSARVEQNLCIGCGLCCSVCDEVFRINEQRLINRQPMKIKRSYKRLLIRVLCLQSFGTINLNAFIFFRLYGNHINENQITLFNNF